jgi:stage III sporulation protein AG
MSTSEKESRMDQKTDSKPKSGILARYMKLDTKKKVQYAVILLIAIVILAIYFTSVSKGQTSDDKDVSAETAAVSAVSVVATDDISAQLKNTLSAIEGAGRVEVMITYESSAELVPAISIDKQSSTTVSESEDGKSTTNSENT